MTSTGSSATVPAAEPVAAAADVVIGIPAYNMARTIEAAVAAVRGAVLGPLRSRPTAVMVLDGGSTDGTASRAAALLQDLPQASSVSCAPSAHDQLSVPFHGVPGRTRALLTLFEAAHASGARVCLLVDAGAPGLTADGVARLIGAVHDEAYDYASGIYHRPAYAGALTKSIVAPMFRTCFGARLRQPMAGEFACSAGFVAHCLDPDVALESADSVAVNLRVAIAAATGGFRVCEVTSGRRAGASREEGLDLSTTVTQVVSALFSELERTAAAWHRVRRSVAVPLLGPPPADAEGEPPDIGPLLEAFGLGYRELSGIWAEFLPPSSILVLKRLASAPDIERGIDDAFWARLVYDFALAYRSRVMARDQLLGSLTPLYLGWLASFLLQIRGMPAAAVQERLEQVGLAFEAERPHLVSGWRWPERFGPPRRR